MKTDFPPSVSAEAHQPLSPPSATPGSSDISEPSHPSSLAVAPARPLSDSRSFASFAGNNQVKLTPPEISQLFLKMDRSLELAIANVTQGLAVMAPHCSPDQLVDGCRLLTARVDKLSSALISLQIKIRLGQPL